MLIILPPELPPLCCSVGFGRQRDVLVPAPGPPHSRAEEVKAGRSEGLLCRGRSAGSLCTHSTTVPATPDSPTTTGSLHGEKEKRKSDTSANLKNTTVIVKWGLTLSRVAVGCPGIFWPRGLLLGEADDTCDFTACSESTPFHLAYIKKLRTKQLLWVQMYLWQDDICRKLLKRFKLKRL